MNEGGKGNEIPMDLSDMLFQNAAYDNENYEAALGDSKSVLEVLNYILFYFISTVGRLGHFSPAKLRATLLGWVIVILNIHSLGVICQKE
jgi:hypothetical protein